MNKSIRALALGTTALIQGALIASWITRAEASIKPFSEQIAASEGELDTLLKEAQLLESRGRYSEAIKIWERVLAHAEKELGPESSPVPRLLNKIALLMMHQGRYASAEPLLRRALAILEKVLGPDHPDVAVSLNNLAGALSEQGQYAAAEPLHRRALAIKEKALGPDHPDVASSLSNLAGILHAQGKYVTAEPLYRRALAIRERALGPDHPDTAKSLTHVAVALSDQGRYSEAETLHRRALTIRERALGPDHHETASSLSNLGSLLSDQGRYSEAEALHRRALAIRERALGPDHYDTASSLSNLGSLLTYQGQYAAAAPLYHRALAIKEKILGLDHPAVATALDNLSVALALQAKYATAEPLQRRALTILKKVLGPEHPDVAIALDNLSSTLVYQGKYAGAEPLQRRAVVILEKALGPGHPETVKALVAFSISLLALGKENDAIFVLEKAMAGRSAWLARELPMMADRIRSEMLEKQGRNWEILLALAKSNPKAAQLALEARLNRQGLLQEIEVRQSLLLQLPKTAQDKASRLQMVTQQLASIALAPEKRLGLREQRDTIQSDLYRQMPQLEIRIVKPEQVAKTLDRDSALVEFQRYELAFMNWESARYIALILKPDNSVQAVPLGSAQDIDATIHQGLAATAEQQSDAEQIWEMLSQQLLVPLLPHLEGSNQWFISPDGELNRVPFSALPAPQQTGRSLGDVVQLRLITTGRELLRLQETTPKSGPDLVVANPSYDNKEQQRGGGASGPQSQQRSINLGSDKWKPLPATEKEGREIASLLSTTMISGSSATTASLQKPMGPRLMHIATHGFFVADQESQPIEPLRMIQEQTSLLKGFKQENPLLRSGLVLAGANQPEADPNDDGYLTAAEALTLNLQGTELVVLSACSTGQGTIRTGEGVYGLQRALTVAGARSTLLSLWKVDDTATAAFMRRYYQLLKAGEGRSEALATVQKEFREGPIEAWRHPYYWAAWQLVGDWRPIKGL